MTAPPGIRNFSRAVSSNQQGIHQQLEKVVRRHLTLPFQRPYPQHAIETFKAIAPLVEEHKGPLIFDSFCGVGESTVEIARQNPTALVLGLDKSLCRLDKHVSNHQSENLSNYHLLRADVDDFWRLAVAAGWKLDKHYLLYPNPWPKASLLKRRVHGSPLFPSLLLLGGVLELRSNWQIYVMEFECALAIAGRPASMQEALQNPPITPFERKYQQAGQALWQCICQLD